MDTLASFDFHVAENDVALLYASREASLVSHGIIEVDHCTRGNTYFLSRSTSEYLFSRILLFQQFVR